MKFDLSWHATEPITIKLPLLWEATRGVVTSDLVRERQCSSHIRIAWAFADRVDKLSAVSFLAEIELWVIVLCEETNWYVAILR